LLCPGGRNRLDPYTGGRNKHFYTQEGEKETLLHREIKWLFFQIGGRDIHCFIQEGEICRLVATQGAEIYIFPHRREKFSFFHTSMVELEKTPYHTRKKVTEK